MTKAKAKTITTTLVADRVTKGAVRFMEQTDDFPINVYLRKEQVEQIGLTPAEGIELTLTLAAA